MAKPYPDPALVADYASCRELIRQGSRSFYVASLLLPPGVRRASIALYAFCRISDDAVDMKGARRDAVDRLRDRLDRVYAGRPAPDPVDRAFADVVERSDLPRALPEALLDGLSWDVEGRRYDTLSDLNAYAARVAATVGAMMTVLMGARDATVLARACDLGVAMQLTNIARDVGEDARAGRLYLPLAWLAEEGVDPEAFLAAPVFDRRIGAVVGRLLAVAEALYTRAGPGVAGLPVACRPAIQAARLIYRDIGVQVSRRGGDSVSSRAFVPGRRKLALVGAALGAALAPGPMSGRPGVPEAQFLVDAAAWSAADAPRARSFTGVTPPWRFADERIGWAIELLSSLEQRRPEGSSAAQGSLIGPSS